jgi:hypothetical protein
MEATHAMDSVETTGERFVALRVIIGFLGIVLLNSSVLRNAMLQLFGFDERVPSGFAVSLSSSVFSLLIAIKIVQLLLRARATTQR